MRLLAPERDLTEGITTPEPELRCGASNVNAPPAFCEIRSSARHVVISSLLQATPARDSKACWWGQRQQRALRLAFNGLHKGVELLLRFSQHLVVTGAIEGFLQIGQALNGIDQARF